MQTNYGHSALERDVSFDVSFKEIETFYAELSANTELLEAVELLNELCGTVDRVEEYKVGTVCKEVLLVDIESNSIRRVISRIEVLIIAKTLKRLQDLQMH